MEMNYRERAMLWTGEAYDVETRTRVNAMLNGDPKELEDAFYKNLEFGTGGLRGIMGAGTNRMNVYNVRRATTGFARFLTETYGEDAKKRGVAIAYDSRNNSQLFAREAALTMAAAGIPAGLVRLSCGLESKEDLIEDIKQALEEI